MLSNDKQLLTMYKNNSGIIAITDVYEYKKRSVLNQKAGDIKPLLFLY